MSNDTVSTNTIMENQGLIHENELLVIYKMKHHNFIWYDQNKSNYFKNQHFSWLTPWDTLNFSYILNYSDLTGDQIKKIVFNNPAIRIFSLITGCSPYQVEISFYLYKNTQWNQIYTNVAKGKENSHGSIPIQNATNDQILWILKILENIWGIESTCISDSLSAIVAGEFSNNVEGKFTWSWWAIEWWINNLATTRAMLNYEFDESGIKFRTKLKNEIRTLFSRLRSEYLTNSNPVPEFRTEYEILQNTINGLIFRPTLKNNLKSSQGLIEKLKLFQDTLYALFSNESKSMLESFIDIDFSSVLELVSNEIYDYRNALAHRGFDPLIVQDSEKIKKFPANVNLLLLVYFAYPDIKKTIAIDYTYNTKPVEYEILKTIKKIYYFDFWKNSSYTLKFREFEITSKTQQETEYKFEFDSFENSNLILKSDSFNFFSSVVSKTGSQTSSIASRLPVGEAINTLEIVDESGEIHFADVFVTKQSGDQTTLSIYRIYNKKEFDLLINRK
ncbi:MAG: hypothetical protein HeimC2_45720 [Candidatus Heimdallarchaeota archaeon LC_2]|nr:MAG: hypothetical protein HeimC2_45720 [Candidatus Heimdallarchaeota archaeon LC_2]